MALPPVSGSRPVWPPARLGQGKGILSWKVSTRARTPSAGQGPRAVGGSSEDGPLRTGHCHLRSWGVSSRPRPVSDAVKQSVRKPAGTCRSETSLGDRWPPFQTRQAACIRLWSRPTRCDGHAFLFGGGFSRVCSWRRYIGGSITTSPASNRRRNPGESGSASQCR